MSNEIKGFINLIGERVCTWEYVDTFDSLEDAEEFADVGCCAALGVKVTMQKGSWVVHIWNKGD